MVDALICLEVRYTIGGHETVVPYKETEIKHNILIDYGVGLSASVNGTVGACCLRQSERLMKKKYIIDELIIHSFIIHATTCKQT